MSRNDGQPALVGSDAIRHRNQESRKASPPIGDQVDRAIDAAAQPAPGPVGQFNFRFASGRTASLRIDGAADALDLVELIAVIAGHVPKKLEEFRQPASGLVIARGTLPPSSRT